MEVSVEKLEVNEKGVKLSNLKGGEVFHFTSLTTADAVKEDAIFMLSSEAAPENRVKIINVKDGQILVKDNDHKIFKLTTKLNILF